MTNQFLLRAGKAVTRIVLSKTLRRFRLCRSLYVHLYWFGKTLAEKREIQFFHENIRPGMTICDIGAHVGFYTLLFSELVGPDGHVIAFEPDRLSYVMLADQLQKAPYPNVELAQTALGDRTGETSLHCSKVNRADNRIAETDDKDHPEKTTVPITTLDEYRKDSDRNIDAVKIDVQGYELHVLRGMIDLLHKGAAEWIFLEIEPVSLRAAGTTPQELAELLQSSVYALFRFDEDYQPQPIPDFAAFTNSLGQGYTNVLAKKSRSERKADT